MRDNNNNKNYTFCGVITPRLMLLDQSPFFHIPIKYQHVKQKFESIVLKGKEIGTKSSQNLFFYYIDMLENFDLMRSYIRFFNWEE